MSRIISTILLLILVIPLKLTAQEATPSDLPGYIVYSTGDKLQLETLTHGTLKSLPTLQTKNSDMLVYLALNSEMVQHNPLLNVPGHIPLAHQGIDPNDPDLAWDIREDLP